MEKLDFPFKNIWSKIGLGLFQNVSIEFLFLDLEFDLYFFIFHYTVFHGASKMLQELQSSGEMKDLTFVIVFV